MNISCIIFLCFLGLCCKVVQADDNNHMYGASDAVTLWVNTVGPYHNPQETYPYYSLPYCKQEHGIDVVRRIAGIG